MRIIIWIQLFLYTFLVVQSVQAFNKYDIRRIKTSIDTDVPISSDDYCFLKFTNPEIHISALDVRNLSEQDYLELRRLLTELQGKKTRHIDDEEMCSVCHDTWEELEKPNSKKTIHPCGHTLCDYDLTRWVIEENHDRCPKCSQQIDKILTFSDVQQVVTYLEKIRPLSTQSYTVRKIVVCAAICVAGYLLLQWYDENNKKDKKSCLFLPSKERIA